MDAIRIVTVDAFTPTPFRGNPAAVCVLPATRSDDWMFQLAREMNLSETAFVVPRDGEFDLRWLTPAVEVKLCGHATLASAHVLWQDGHLADGQQARFHTKSGLLTADRRGDWIELDFPVTHAVPAQPPEDLLPALGLKSAVSVLKNEFDYLVEVDAESIVRALQANHAVLRTIPVRGVAVTARSSTPEFDCVSRFFAPGSGIDEDPVTGSAHTAIGPYWGAKLGKTELTAYQASARGGVIRLGLRGDRILLRGQAVTMLETTIRA